MEHEEEAENRRYLECGGHIGKGLAVLTSGGDSQGMNAALRAVVRTSLFLGCNTFLVQEGYQGLVNGDLVEATWASVSSVIHKGGTIIGSARCKEFRTREGRLIAAKTLVDAGVNNLVIIGGDGSLTGANMFKMEWSSLIQQLVKDGSVRHVPEGMLNLNVVGIVGTIDNDFCGTDMTLGTDSALHRILEAVDAISCTAYSHQRAFIMEVMGRHCGYLAISAGLLCSATAVFIPEEPPVDWEDDLCETITKERNAGQRLNIIIVSEGAIDRNGEAITSDMIKDVIMDRLHHEARVTVLGHVQRGGNPSAFDRVLGCRMGAEAVIALLESTPDTEATVITTSGNKSVRLPLMECVEKTQKVAKAMAEKNWELAVKLRGRAFERRLEVFKTMHTIEKQKKFSSAWGTPMYTIAVIHIGSPACGMNSTVRAFVRLALINNIKVLGISEGIDGLLRGECHEMRWSEVTGWVAEGGALLGAKRTLPNGKMQEIAARFREFNIGGLFIVGGFEGYLSAFMLQEERANYPEFCIPILVAPATISNNVPGADYSLGCDTALNQIVEICDKMRQSAQGTKRRVFILETMGGYCGYLATLAGLAGGADAAYIYEELFSVKDLHKDLYNLASKMCAGVQRGLILRNEKCSDNYNCEFMTRLFAEEGKGIFSARDNVIGHMQQGGNSSPFDRNMGITVGIKSLDWFINILNKSRGSGKMDANDPDTAGVFGLKDKQYTFTSLTELAQQTDFEKRIPKKQWWLKLRPLLKIIAKHESIYEVGTIVYYDAAATMKRKHSAVSNDMP